MHLQQVHDSDHSLDMVHLSKSFNAEKNAQINHQDEQTAKTFSSSLAVNV